MRYTTPDMLLSREVRVAVIGAGGTGGEVLDGLARMAFSLMKLGHPGIDVEVFDDDAVSEANVGRQRFSPADVGLNKAEILTTRINFFYGFDWSAAPRRFNPMDTSCYSIDLLISCVDTAKTRIQIAKGMEGCRGLWLDFGNGGHTGQVVLGEFSNIHTRLPFRLPTVYDLFGSDLEATDDNDSPSCSLEEALHAQDWPVNRAVATSGLEILWNLLRHGGTDHHGAYVDSRRGVATPMPICPKQWSIYGYEATEDSEEDAA